MRFKKLPSFDALIQAALATFVRFPFTLISAFIAAGTGMVVVDNENHLRDASFSTNLLITSLLGFALFTVLALFAERKSKDYTVKLLYQLVGVVVLVIYFFSLPNSGNFVHAQTTIARFVLLNLAFHFLVAYLPFLGRGQADGFWQYNKSLFLRFLISGIYSVVLFVGLLIALAATDHLFGVHIDYHWYARVWLIVAFVINTWVFLSGVPSDLASLNFHTEYPTGLRIFAQYILLPLIALYLIILYVYEFKIIFQWSWPKGMVSQLVLWYSAVGILAMLLLWPLRELLENKWIRTYTKWFFRLLIPLVGMLFFAIMRRITDYGITPNRYFVLLMAIGLFVVLLHFVFSRKKDIRIIPIILSILALVSAYGPFSAFSVSERNQVSRLNDYVLKYHLTPAVETQTPSDTISTADWDDMTSIIRYLGEWHGPSAFATWIPDSVLKPMDTVDGYAIATQLAPRFGVSLNTSPTRIHPGAALYFSANVLEEGVQDISHYQYAVPFHFTMSPIIKSQSQLLPNGDTCALRLSITGDSLHMELRNSAVEPIDRFALSLRDTLWLNNPKFDTKLPREQMTRTFTGQHYDLAVLVSTIQGNVYTDSLTLDMFAGTIFVGKR